MDDDVQWVAEQCSCHTTDIFEQALKGKETDFGVIEHLREYAKSGEIPEAVQAYCDDYREYITHQARAQLRA